MISYSNRLRTTIFPVKQCLRNSRTDATLPNNCSNTHIRKKVLRSIKGMRDNVDNSQTFTHIIWIFKNFFYKMPFYGLYWLWRLQSLQKKLHNPLQSCHCSVWVIWWKYTPTCTKRVCKQGCKVASDKSHPRGRGLFSVDISGTSSVKWLYQVSMTYPQLISAAAFFFLPLNTIMSGRCQQVSW